MLKKSHTSIDPEIVGSCMSFWGKRKNMKELQQMDKLIYYSTQERWGKEKIEEDKDIWQNKQI